MSNPTIITKAFLACEDNWTKLRTLPAGEWYHEPMPQLRRESYELTAAALIYHTNALRVLPKDRPHVNRQGAIQAKAMYEIVALHDSVPDHLSEAAALLWSSMHLASAMLRLSLACYLLAARSPCRPSLETLLNANRNDWDRDGLLLQQLQTIGVTCRLAARESAPGRPLTPQQCLAILVAHRDEFGHGEDGSTHQRSGWRASRGQFFGSLCWCMHVEAQQGLLQWAISELQSIATFDSG